MSELLLIAVPGSDGDGAAVLRVVVVPRLDAAENVAATPLSEWPEAISAARFDVELEGGETIAGLRPHVELQPGAWEGFFGSIAVEQAPPPVIGEQPLVVETARHGDAVAGTYQAVASVSIDPQAPATQQPDLDAAVRDELQQTWAEMEAPPPPPPPAAEGESQPAPPAPDFHRVLSLLREHPAVMRALGLVFSLPLDAARLPRSGVVRARWPAPPAGLPPVVSPPTAFELNETRGFVPASTETVKAGLVDLGDGDVWTTTTFDVDGAVDRLRDAASTVAATGGDLAVRLPALRSAGIALLRRDRGAELNRRRGTAAANARLGSLEDAPPLTAEDLMLGLRLDVRFKGESEWTSLCRREATYRVGGQEIAAAEEEGHVKPGAVVRHAGETQPRADEVVARWTGWSLAVPQARPGAAAAGAGAGAGAAAAAAPEGRRAALPFDFDWEFAVPSGSLPQLRFGHDYHLRARVADLAGGGVPPTDGDVVTGTEAISYARHEPVGSPNLAVGPELDAGRLGPGGTATQLVVRSDAPDYPRNDLRTLSAPVTTLDLAVQHGVLAGADEPTFARVQRALAGGLPDPAAEGMTVFPRPEPGSPSDRTWPVGWPGDWPEAGPLQLRLRARADGDTGPPLRPVRAVVEVHLAPAEQLTVELSCFLRNDFADHFALHRWQTDDASIAVLKDGRHPMATPSIAVTLVHAIRRQTTAPGGTIAVEQVPGGTTATLRPDAASALLGAVPAATLQLQVSARYDEVDDEVTQRIEAAPVGVVAIARGDEALGAPLVHAFGDTRHRTIVYQLAAVGRFRHLYDADEDDEQFVARGELAEISVKSTARPPLPAVRAVVPAFGWSEEVTPGGVVTHRREGGRLRVELLRPWHHTGAGEQLAVIAERTEAGRDPIWDTPLPERNPPAAAHLPSAGQTTARLPDGEAVTVVPCDVRFSGEHWFADVALPSVAAASYRPFVRLAVARYQRESLPDLELSAAVRTDLVQLLPERTLTVDPSDPAAVAVTLAGLGPDGPNRNRVDVVLERADGEPGVEATSLEAPDGGIAAWTVVAIGSGGLGETISVPRQGAGERVRIREVELLAPPGQPPAPQAGAPGELTERVVFTDVVALP